MSGKHRLLLVRKLRIFAENFSRVKLWFFCWYFLGGWHFNQFFNEKAFWRRRCYYVCGGSRLSHFSCHWLKSSCNYFQLMEFSSSAGRVEACAVWLLGLSNCIITVHADGLIKLYKLINLAHHWAAAAVLLCLVLPCTVGLFLRCHSPIYCLFRVPCGYTTVVLRYFILVNCMFYCLKEECSVYETDSSVWGCI